MTSLHGYLEELAHRGPLAVICGHYGWPGRPNDFAITSVRDAADATANLKCVRNVFLDDIAASAMCNGLVCSTDVTAPLKAEANPRIESWLGAHLESLQQYSRSRGSKCCEMVGELQGLLRDELTRDAQHWPDQVQALLGSSRRLDARDWLAGLEMVAYMTNRSLFRPWLLEYELETSVPPVLFERSMVNAASRALHKLGRKENTALDVRKGEDGTTRYSVHGPSGRTIELRHESTQDGFLRAANKCSAILSQLFHHCCKELGRKSSSDGALSVFYIIPCHDRARLADGIWTFGQLYANGQGGSRYTDVTIASAFYRTPERGELLCDEYSFGSAGPPKRTHRITVAQSSTSRTKTPSKQVYVAYVDNNATTQVDPTVVRAMMPYFTQACGNPSSAHTPGWEAELAVAEARDEVASLIGAKPDEIFFTSGATESNNWLLTSLDVGATGNLITSSIEHKSVLEVAHLIECRGRPVHYVPLLEDGTVDYQGLLALPIAQGSLVSLMAVNNEIHSILELQRVGEICARRGAVFHTDAAQAAGRVELDVRRMKIGAMSLSAHKFHGPKGIGALFIARELQARLTPLLVGGGQQENFRSGTLPTALIVGMGKASLLARDSLAEESVWLRKLAEVFLATLQAEGVGYQLIGPHELGRRRPGALCISVPGLNSTQLCELLPGISISQGSACNSRGVDSHVLRALAMDADAAKTVLRLAFSRFNSIEEARGVAHALASVMPRLWRQAPTYADEYGGLRSRATNEASAATHERLEVTP